ncbi:MAG: histone deacetylase [Verrucomicrobiae bacterium]|nr:histone deacetylase [Verrucomicrobiae bacterium]MCP5549646.1 histone deacetylase [Akkermansiaceae bacterium]
MKTGLLLDPLFTRHRPGSHHPEAPGRIEAIIRELESRQLPAKCAALAPRDITDDEILRCHTDAYLKTVLREIDGQHFGELSTGDTRFGPESLDTARQAAGGLLNAVDAVFAGEVRNAFCAVRPPGHHATASRGMGFCIFNNAALAARHARAVHGAERVAIIDWDVHHGNGTQDIFYEDGGVFYFSTHQHPWYPGTGMTGETGAGAGKNTTLNHPLPAGTGMEAIEKAFRDDFAKKMKDYRPDLVIVSAGFDSRLGDPLGDFRLTDADFAGLTKILAELAGEFAGGRLVSVLEGGYRQEGLAQAVATHVETLIAAAAASG